MNKKQNKSAPKQFRLIWICKNSKWDAVCSWRFSKCCTKKYTFLFSQEGASRFVFHAIFTSEITQLKHCKDKQKEAPNRSNNQFNTNNFTNQLVHITGQRSCSILELTKLDYVCVQVRYLWKQLDQNWMLFFVRWCQFCTFIHWDYQVIKYFSLNGSEERVQERWGYGNEFFSFCSWYIYFIADPSPEPCFVSFPLRSGPGIPGSSIRLFTESRKTLNKMSLLL